LVSYSLIDSIFIHFQSVLAKGLLGIVGDKHI